MKSVSTLLALTIALSTSGCATVLAGGPSHVDVTLDQPVDKVDVTLRNDKTGETQVLRDRQTFHPLLDKAADYTLTVSAPSIDTQTYHIGRTASPWLYLDGLPLVLGLVSIVGGGAIAGSPSNSINASILTGVGGVLSLAGLGLLGVDVLTGNALAHTPNPVTVDVTKKRL